MLVEKKDFNTEEEGIPEVEFNTKIYKIYIKECYGNHQTQHPMTAQAVNLTVRISSGEYELCIHKRT